MKLLEGLLVLDFSQFLSGPSASLRMADLGARVIKIERTGVGDICRTLYVSDTMIEGDSTIFHAINRNKESFEADLKNTEDLAKIIALIKKADVMIHNFRPGVMERIGLDYEAMEKINPQLIYASISGYGNEGEWKDRPGQDLLLQSVSGITCLSGNAADPPVPMGVAVGDILAGTQLVQGVLAAVWSRFETGKGALVQLSMLESLLDFQFEVLSCYLNDGEELPVRSRVNNGHAYIAAPYGIYSTADGFLSLAMGNILQLAALLPCKQLEAFTDSSQWFEQRDQIKCILQDCLLLHSTAHWLAILEPADIWCAEVHDYDSLVQQEGYQLLKMEQTVISGNKKIRTTRCPIRVDHEIITSEKGAPALGEHTAAVTTEFDLKSKTENYEPKP